MINKVFAQNFVKKMYHTMNLKVNVMDQRGVIVASASKERIGDFHLCAYEIIQKNLPMLITKEPTRELIGVNAPGVNLRLSSNNETIGVIGVTGDPDKIIEIAKMAKLTFETMYEYEYKKNAAMKGNSGIWNFSHVLLSESPINEFSIQKAAAKLGYSDNLPRIPIYIPILSEYRNTVILHFLDGYTSLRCYLHQDIVLPVEKGILYMKACKKPLQEMSFREYTLQTTDCIKEEFLEREITDNQSLSYQFLIGPIQLCFFHYQSIYQNLLWLSKNQTASAFSTVFLTDHLTELLAQQVSHEFLEPLFIWYQQQIENHMEKEFFLETTRQLSAADMKLETAAQNLHLHKNSVIARLKKIKELLEINPISSPRDAAFLQYLRLFMES